MSSFENNDGQEYTRQLETCYSGNYGSGSGSGSGYDITTTTGIVTNTTASADAPLAWAVAIFVILGIVALVAGWNLRKRYRARRSLGTGSEQTFTSAVNVEEVTDLTLLPGKGKPEMRW